MTMEEEVREALVRCRELIAEHDPDAWPFLEIGMAAKLPSLRIGSAVSFFLYAKSRKLRIGRKKVVTIGGMANSLAEAEAGFKEGLEKVLLAIYARDEGLWTRYREYRNRPPKKKRRVFNPR